MKRIAIMRAEESTMVREDFRTMIEFADDFSRIFQSRGGRLPSVLINTPLQRGVGDGERVETVLTVSMDCGKPFKRFSCRPPAGTALKRGVNEMDCEVSGSESDRSGGRDFAVEMFFNWT